MENQIPRPIERNPGYRPHRASDPVSSCAQPPPPRDVGVKHEPEEQDSGKHQDGASCEEVGQQHEFRIHGFMIEENVWSGSEVPFISHSKCVIESMVVCLT